MTDGKFYCIFGHVCFEVIFSTNLNDFFQNDELYEIYIHLKYAFVLKVKSIFLNKAHVIKKINI